MTPTPNSTSCNESVSGTVYHDINGDGQYDQSPPQTKPFVDRGLESWTVLLKDKNGVFIKSATSNYSGSYYFNNLCAGIYNVSEDIKSGWKVVEPVNNIYTLNISQYGSAYVDFGNLLIEPSVSSPKIDSISPSTGSITKDFVIKGSFFGSEPGSVVFCINPSDCSYGAPINSWNETEIRAKVPGGLTQTKDYEVYMKTKDNKSSNRIIFTLIAGQPQIDNISPSGAKPGKEVTFTGSNYGTLNGQVNFYKTYPNIESTASIVSWDNNIIRAIIPSNLVAGTEYGVEIISSAGAPSSFKYYTLGTN